MQSGQAGVCSAHDSGCPGLVLSCRRFGVTILVQSLDDLVIHEDQSELFGAVILTVAKAENAGKRQNQPHRDGGAVFLDPFANAFALLVFVVKFYGHVKSVPCWIVRLNRLTGYDKSGVAVDTKQLAKFLAQFCQLNSFLCRVAAQILDRRLAAAEFLLAQNDAPARAAAIGPPELGAHAAA